MDLCDFSLDMGSNDNIDWTRESLAGGCHKKPSSKVKDLPFFRYPSARCLVVQDSGKSWTSLRSTDDNR